MKRTPLYERHVELGASMGAFAGYLMPLRYAGIRGEVGAVRQAAGLFDVSHMGEFFIEGSQAVAFVDYLLTNDFMGASLGKAVYSPLCNEEGGIIDDLIAYKLDEDCVLLCVNAANVQKDRRWILSKMGGFRARLSDLSDRFSLLALQGPHSHKISKACGLSGADGLGNYGVARAVLYGFDVIVASTGYTGEDGLEIFLPNGAVRKLWDVLLEEGAVPCALAARDTLRIEAGYPLYGSELSEGTNPLDAGLKWTVKFGRRDFLGKAALEGRRASYVPLRLSLEKGVPRTGYPVVDSEGRAIGRVTSGTYSPSLGRGIALASVEKKKLPEDGIFCVKIRGKIFKARRHKGAFIKGGGG